MTHPMTYDIDSEDDAPDDVAYADTVFGNLAKFVSTHTHTHTGALETNCITNLSSLSHIYPIPIDHPPLISKQAP
jgi:hypothetical protein